MYMCYFVYQYYVVNLQFNLNVNVNFFTIEFNSIGSLESAYAAALQAHVAKLVTSPPAGMMDKEKDKEVYFTNIAKQTIDLALYGLFKNDMVRPHFSLYYLYLRFCSSSCTLFI